MANPITRDRVERAIAGMRGDAGAWSVLPDTLGEDWVDAVPGDVRIAWQRGEWGACIVALTRWRDELAAAEPVPVAHHAASERVAERLRAMTPAEGLAALVDAGIVTPDGELTDAYRARPEPAEDSPERLRERRERLGLSTVAAGNLPGMGGLNENDVVCCEARAECPICARSNSRATYAAALSAEEARRAELAAERDAHAVPRLGWLDPERPAPRFKVGEWVRVVSNGTVYQVGEIATPFGGNAYYFRETGGAENSWQAAALEPASPPAPEVVDVPQPVTIVKRCAGVKATWHQGGEVLSIVEDDAYETDIPLALILAMADAIRAQQGGAS